MPPNPNFDYERYKRTLARTTIPEKILCKLCKRIRAKDYFSKTQLATLHQAIALGKTTGLNGKGYIPCRECTSKQAVELTCCVCDKTKGLDHFSKNQRRDPDNARCINCVQGHLDTDPVNDENKQLAECETNLESTTYNKSENAIESGMRTLNMAADTDASTNAAAAATPAVGAAFIRDPTAVPKNSALISFVGNPEGRDGTERGGAGSVVSGVSANSAHRSNWDAWGIAPSTRAVSAVPVAKNANFAKVPGNRFPKTDQNRPMMFKEEPKEQTVHSDSDESDEDVSQWL